MSARKYKQRAIIALERAKKAPKKPRIYKKTHIAPHMIELPLAAALVEATQKNTPSQSRTAQTIIDRLVTQKTWSKKNLDYIGIDNIIIIESSKLVLQAWIILSEDIEWRQGRLQIKNIPIPEILKDSLIGKSIKKLIEHPWLHEDIIIKSIHIWPENGFNASSLATVELINHQPTIKYALKLLGANH